MFLHKTFTLDLPSRSASFRFPFIIIPETETEASENRVCVVMLIMYLACNVTHPTATGGLSNPRHVWGLEVRTTYDRTLRTLCGLCTEARVSYLY